MAPANPGRLTCLLTDGEPDGYLALIEAEAGILNVLEIQMPIRTADDLAFDLRCEALRARRIAAVQSRARTVGRNRKG